MAESVTFPPADTELRAPLLEVSSVPALRMRLGGAAVDLLRRDQLLAAVEATLCSPAPPLFIASANLDHLHHFGQGSGRAGLFEQAQAGGRWLVLLDGMPLVWAARRLTGRNWEQLAGSDLLPAMLTAATDLGAGVGFLGGSPATQQALSSVLRERLPGLRIAGGWSPPRHEVNDPQASQRLARRIREAGVDLLVVGLGKPRQELWLAEHGSATGARVALAFGAAMDFVAGTVRRAPPGWRRAGLEWFYRLAHEPLRLAPRYLLRGPPALAMLIRTQFASARSGSHPPSGPGRDNGTSLWVP